ncbi:MULTISPECIES: threonine/serine exporter family protein [Clostridium]|uniref:threonine/serine exporter family protein n=1 Tax=Clostridium TaxID=1485 RepID=UPI000824378D|nr:MULTISPECIES: threonine/serine exporter family protein [Clostridium]PJI09768.1 threonine/serine exporter [Clostridium sp. CT7]
MILNFIYAFIACAAFSILFNIKGKRIFIASLGGGLGWLIYILCIHYNVSITSSNFIAAMVVSIYCEIMARASKTPVIVYSVSGIIPLVPGNGMYNTMYETITGNLSKASEWGFKTLMYAGSIAVAIILVSSLARLIKMKRSSSALEH